MNERHFLGLTYNEAPPNIDLCRDLDETFKCVYNNHRPIFRQIPKLKVQFDIFANHYNRLQRACESMLYLFISASAENIKTIYDEITDI